MLFIITKITTYNRFIILSLLNSRFKTLYFFKKPPYFFLSFKVTCGDPNIRPLKKSYKSTSTYVIYLIFRFRKSIETFPIFLDVQSCSIFTWLMFPTRWVLVCQTHEKLVGVVAMVGRKKYTIQEIHFI